MHYEFNANKTSAFNFAILKSYAYIYASYIYDASLEQHNKVYILCSADRETESNFLLFPIYLIE